MNQSDKLVDRIKAALNAELAKHEPELSGPDTSEVRLTVKVSGQRVRKVIYSRVTESEIE